jgi:A/G-specific adenine glycosylase
VPVLGVPRRRTFNRRLFAWHDPVARQLAIRQARTSWEVLVGEVMSQQTQVERVGPAWQRFVARWPTPGALAGADTHELLAAWSGLGYNRRALALREAARAIVAEHDGHVPRKVETLESLPGVGPYTARAVAATAFGIPVAPLDVNVRRVVSRVLGIAPTARELQSEADALVSRRQARRWLDAVMDLASAVCTIRDPPCDACPLARMCASRGQPLPAAARTPSASFPATSRWLRGRLVALATASPSGTWVALPDRLGAHGADAIVVAAATLEREGFLELRDGELRVRA